MKTEKELRKIGFKVLQRVTYKTRWFRQPKKIFTGYDIYKWDGEEWVAFPLIEV